MSKLKIQNINFDDLPLCAAADLAVERIDRGIKTAVVTPNSEIAYDCRRDPELLRLINSANLILPDGVGILYASKIAGTALGSRVAGIDFAYELLSRFAKSGVRLFLLGAKPGVADLAAQKLCERFPGLSICGTADGYFKSDADAVEIINRSGAQAVFVCLGFPKQERFIMENRDRVCASLMIGLGGCLDVFSGNVARAPEIFIKLGLEWFYRLITQPTRIKRMAKLPLFMFDVLGDRIFRRG